MHPIKLRLIGRLSFVSICVAFWLSSIALLFTGEGVAIIIGFCLVALGFLGCLLIVCIPLKDEIPSMHDALKHSKLVWGLWFSGDRHIDLIQGTTSIKRILLMELGSPAFADCVEISGSDWGDVEKSIKKLTHLAISKGIKVRWYSTPIRIGLTIYDPLSADEPSSDKAYYVMSILATDVPRSKRPLYVIKKADDEAEFNNQVIKFKKIWETSREPKPEEYIE